MSTGARCEKGMSWSAWGMCISHCAGDKWGRQLLGVVCCWLVWVLPDCYTPMVFRSDLFFVLLVIFDLLFVELWLELDCRD